MNDYWFRCPNCGLLGAIDEEQAEGIISIVCPGRDADREALLVIDGGLKRIEREGGTCDFHATGLVRPKVPTTETISRDFVTSFGG